MTTDPDPATVLAAIADVGRTLRADGAELVLLAADPKTARIHLRLELHGVNCEECLLPPDMLMATLTQSLQARIPGEFELIVDDPRRQPPV